jgi:hypothetical protein
MKEIWRLHGIPEKMVSDRGTQFTSNLMKGIFKRLGIEGAYSTAYHPQTDGLSERTNQELKQYLRNYCNYRQDDWAKYLPMAEFAHNNAANSTTKQSPFLANYGYHPKTFLTRVATSNTPEADKLVDRIVKLQDELKAAMKMGEEETKRYHDRKATGPVDFKVGDKVWLDSQNIKTTAPTKTLADRRLGPYEIEKKYSDLAYRLKLPTTMKIHPTFHPSYLYPYEEDKIEGRQEPPLPPIEIEGEEEYEVEKILDGRLWRNQRQYLVKWKGYSDADNTWEPERNLEHAEQIIKRFHANHPRFKWETRRPRKSPATS